MFKFKFLFLLTMMSVTAHASTASTENTSPEVPPAATPSACLTALDPALLETALTLYDKQIASVRSGRHQRDAYLAAQANLIQAFEALLGPTGEIRIPNRMLFLRSVGQAMGSPNLSGILNAEDTEGFVSTLLHHGIQSGASEETIVAAFQKYLPILKAPPEKTMAAEKVVRGILRTIYMSLRPRLLNDLASNDAEALANAFLRFTYMTHEQRVKLNEYLRKNLYWKFQPSRTCLWCDAEYFQEIFLVLSRMGYLGPRSSEFNRTQFLDAFEKTAFPSSP